MIISVDFGSDFVQFISCSSKVENEIKNLKTNLQTEGTNDFLEWIEDEEKNTKYWAYIEGERICPQYDANAIVDWLNNVKFPNGDVNAKLINEHEGEIDVKLYF